ncbi:family 43 glycosylhydrolase [Anaerocolumna sedimenticola]|uniref:Family 43 glycosylhydrolase n=1 Tax=Anaerocolumna sedimenticola TaxID=2696063 RepID=A0A6P1THQ1_9FIRM|nr:glycoside hydrolase family 43 protein [Anaerocolumna sedimenticola]QHQ59619.1 family 43 glycosylhydrolase [Anaerocolumna sedimenticola]
MNIKNPIPIDNIGDPYILYFEGKYYLYATCHFNGYYCWISENMNDWKEPVVCYEATDKSFGNSCFWAPEVYFFNGKFYMYYTAQWKIYKEEALRIGVAVSDKPEGPFEDVLNEQPMFDFGYGVLDAHILKDGEHNYFYYSRAGADHYVNGAKESEIYAVELGEDFISVKGEGNLILRPEQDWERIYDGEKQFWNEGPFVMKEEGRYHMMYSANFYASKHYGIGCAVSDNPMGPFKKYENNPILSTTDIISGPGHNSVVKALDGKYYCIYHAHTYYDNPSGDRQVYITPLMFQSGKIYMEHPRLDTEQ